ncbi:hypothetical protein HY417_02600 [Candidatus Kaiserbacteria bacterium]|nr:hypothetical protein [Candidatus Kaiserbacteria bacterium]
MKSQGEMLRSPDKGSGSFGPEEVLPTAAENILDLNLYKDVPEAARPLVAAIEHVVDKFNIKEPRVVEVGPVPTSQYQVRFGPLGQLPSKYDPMQKTPIREESIQPPIRFIAERHPDWKLAAVSPHPIPAEEKKRLLGKHARVFLTKLGPKRTKGIGLSDVVDEEYARGQSTIRHYPILQRRLGGQPNIIFGRHVFDRTAEGYLVRRLTMASAMLLEVGGYFISQVSFSGPTDSKIPTEVSFAFEWKRGMKHVMTLEFPRQPDRKEYVYVYQKISDGVLPQFKTRTVKEKF